MNRLPAVIGALTFPVVSWLLALEYIASKNWFGSGDLGFAAFWSLLPVPAAYVVLRSFDRRSGSWGSLKAYAVAGVCGIAAGTGWTFLVAFLLQGWLGIASFPVLRCWLSGAVAAFVVSVVVRRPRTWPLAVVAVVFPVVAAGVLLRVLFVQPPDILVQLVPHATQQQVDNVWDAIRPIKGTMAMYRWDGDTGPRIGVSFRRGTRRRRRAEIVAEIRRHPLVVGTSDLEPTPPGTVKGRSPPPVR